MNIMTTNRLQRLAAAWAFSVLSLTLAATLPAAADGFDPPKLIVKYGELDMSRAPGATALYNRIHTAAQKVCSQFDGRSLSNNAHMDACVKRAVAEAVATVNEPTLFAVYDAKAGTVPPTRVASLSDR